MKRQYEQQRLNFDTPRGQALADTGLELALETANQEHPEWKERCWRLFWQWLNQKKRPFRFLIEDFRKYVYDNDLLERPRSDRAFGFLSKKAAKEGLILFDGTSKVKNTKAHSANAAIWVKL